MNDLHLLKNLFPRCGHLTNKELVGKLGEGYSDTLRTIIMNWSSEKGYLNKGGKSEKTRQELAEEVELLDTMLTSLVELLEEKGVLTQEEWEKRIKERITIE